MKNKPSKLAVVNSTAHEGQPKPDFVVGPEINKKIHGYHITVVRVEHDNVSGSVLGIFGHN